MPHFKQHDRAKCPKRPLPAPRRAAAIVCAAFVWGAIPSADGQDVPKPGENTTSLAAPPPLQIVDPHLFPSAREAKPGKVVIRGLTSIEEEKARNMIRFQLRNLEENGITMARADDAAFFLEQRIRQTGFDTATVEWEIEDDNSVLLTVDEGGKLFFGDLTVIGNRHLSDAAVRELLTKITRERLGYRTDAPKIPYVAEDVEEGAKGVRHFYTLLGYTDVEVELVSADQPPGSDSMDVTLKVTEGTVSRVGELTFPPAINPQIETVYAEIETEFAEKPFTEAVSANLADRITTAANEAGYFDAAVTVDPSKPRSGSTSPDGEPQRFVDLNIRSDWGNLYTLATVDVTGIEKIREGVIDRRFEDLLGKPYSPTASSKAVEELLQTGAFTALSIEPSPQPDGTISLSVAVEEADRKRLGVYGGFGTYEGGIIGLEYRNSNYLRRLHKFEATAELNARGLRGDVEYSNPWIFNTDWELQLGASSLSQQNEGYTIWDTGLRFGVQKVFGPDEKHRVVLFIKPDYSTVTDFEIEEQFLGPTDYFTSVAGMVYSFGKKDESLTSTQGFSGDFILTGASSAIGSEVEFGRAAVRAVYILPFGKSTLRLGARAGIIKPFGDDQLPIDLRYFSGGPRSVRSFRERDLGPTTNMATRPAANFPPYSISNTTSPSPAPSAWHRSPMPEISSPKPGTPASTACTTPQVWVSSSTAPSAPSGSITDTI